MKILFLFVWLGPLIIELIGNSPEGYEDENGFHNGKEPATP